MSQILWLQETREAALEILEKSSKTTAAISFNKGNLLFELGKDEAAVKEFLEAIETFPSFRRAHRNLGLALYRVGEQERALNSLIEAVRLGDQRWHYFWVARSMSA